MRASLRALIRRHPLAAYFALTFGVAWAGSLIVAGPKLIRGEALQLADAVVMLLPMIVGPSLAAGVLTAIVEGQEGVARLFRGMFGWQVGAQWYAALLVFPALIVLVLLILQQSVSSDYVPGLFLPGIVAGLIAGFFEEVGWTGYAYPRMRRRLGMIWAGIGLGGIHAVWHVLPDYLGASAARGDWWLIHFLGFAVFVVALRLLIAWVNTNTKSLLMAQLMHASSTGFLLILVPLSLSPAHDTLFYWVYSIVLWIVIAIGAMAYRWRPKAFGGEK